VLAAQVTARLKALNGGQQAEARRILAVIDETASSKDREELPSPDCSQLERLPPGGGALRVR
jgi:hypothetical protein